MNTDYLQFPFTTVKDIFSRGKSYLVNLAGTLTYINRNGTRCPLALAPIVTAVSPLTGAAITCTPDLDQTYVITPAGTIAALTINLPSSGNSKIGQIKRFNSTQIVTALTVAVSGSGTVSGAALTAAAVNVPYAFQCVSVTGAGTWMRIQ
jgi:hypothetical protein